MRANNPKDLLSDLKIIRVMLKSQQISSSGAGGSAGGVGSASAVPAGAVAARAAMSLEVLQQLPNTVSVSFRGVKSYEVIDMLSDKVCENLSFAEYNALSDRGKPLVL